MTTITRDLPYFDVDFTDTATPANSVVGSAVVSTTDTGSEFVLPNLTSNIDSGHYGVGSDFINYPTDIPDGYTLTGGQYVVIAYAEATDTIPVSTTSWGYTPAPLTEPFLRNAGNGTVNIVDGLPSGGYAGEVVQRVMDPSLLANGPAGTWRIAENLYNGDPAPKVHVAYLALRLTYTGPDELDLPCDTDVALDLSTAEQVTDDHYAGDTGPYGQYSDGVIWPIPSSTDPWVAPSPEFFFAGLVTEAKPYKVTLTYDPDSVNDRGGRGFALASLPAGGEQDAMAAGSYEYDLYGGGFGTDLPDTATVTIHPEAGKNIMFLTSYEGAVSAITIRKVCDDSLDPVSPEQGGTSGGSGGAPPHDAPGPNPPSGPGAPAPNPVTGGYLTPGNRRAAPTGLEVTVDGAWLSLHCQWGDPRISSAWPGGCANASWTAQGIPSRLTRAGLDVAVKYAGQTVWAGVLAEPDTADGQMSAVGLFTLGQDFAALDSDGNATIVPDTAIAAAIARGLKWKRSGSISDAAVDDLDVSQGPITVGALLDAYCEAEAKRWGVDPLGYVYAATDPTVPNYYVQDFAPLTPATDDLTTALVGRYYNGSGYATTIVTSASEAWLGYHEQTVDLTGRGTITETRAQHILANLLKAGASTPSWAQPLVVTYGELQTAGQVPAALETVQAGTMVRSLGQLDDTQQLGGRTWVDVVVGAAELYQGQLSLTAIGSPVRTLSDVLAKAAQAS